MTTNMPVSVWIAKLGSLQPVSGAEAMATEPRVLDEGETAAATLIAYGEAALPELIDATQSDDWIVRYRAADVLGFLKSEAAVATLVALLGDKNLHVQSSAEEALTQESPRWKEAFRRAASQPDLVEFLQQPINFDLTCYLSVFGAGELRQVAQSVLAKLGGFEIIAHRTVLDASLAYPEQSRNFRALKAVWKQANPRREFDRSPLAPEILCKALQETGTEQQKFLAEQFLRDWTNETQNLRPGSAPVNPSMELLRGVAFSATPNGSQELVRAANEPEIGSSASGVPVLETVRRKFWNVFGSGRSQNTASSTQLQLPSGEKATDSTVPQDAAIRTSTPVPSFSSGIESSFPVVQALQEYARHKHWKVWLLPVSAMEMILIPAGTFLMGDENQRDNPRRKVSLDAYLIAKNPTTVKQYMAFVKATGHGEPVRPSWGWKDDHPIVSVSWENAQAYCGWLSQQIGRTVALPTAAQWEKAARGTIGLKYPWGNEWNGSKCANNVGKNSLQSTVAVGSYPLGASPYGVLDMAGNVWDWCSDWYDENYPENAPSRNPGGPEMETARALRGGSWDGDIETGFRCAFQVRDVPVDWYSSNGFRCVVSADSD